MLLEHFDFRNSSRLLLAGINDPGPQGPRAAGPGCGPYGPGGAGPGTGPYGLLGPAGRGP